MDDLNVLRKRAGLPLNESTIVVEADNPVMKYFLAKFKEAYGKVSAQQGQQHRERSLKMLGTNPFIALEGILGVSILAAIWYTTDNVASQTLNQLRGGQPSLQLKDIVELLGANTMPILYAAFQIATSNYRNKGSA